MLRKEGAGKTVPRRKDPRPDENQLLEKMMILTDTGKVENVFKFRNCPPFWNVHVPLLDVQDFLDDVHPPHVLLCDLVVLDVGNTLRLEIINILEICHRRMFLRFAPVVVLTSCLVRFRSCCKTGFDDFLILFIKPRYFLTRSILRPRSPERGSTRYLCVSGQTTHNLNRSVEGGF